MTTWFACRICCQSCTWTLYNQCPDITVWHFDMKSMLFSLRLALFGDSSVMTFLQRVFPSKPKWIIDWICFYYMHTEKVRLILDFRRCVCLDDGLHNGITVPWPSVTYVIVRLFLKMNQKIQVGNKPPKITYLGTMGSVVMLTVLVYLKCILICIALSHWFPLVRYTAVEIIVDSYMSVCKWNNMPCMQSNLFVRVSGQHN